MRRRPCSQKNIPTEKKRTTNKKKKGKDTFHDPLDLAHPVLDIAGGVDVLPEGDVLALGRVHDGDAHVRLELDLVDVLEALAQVRLHGLRVLGLREDLQQLVVGQEVEAREADPLRLQVLAQALQHLLEQFVAFFELVAEPGVRTQADHLLVANAKYRISCNGSLRRFAVFNYSFGN